MLAFEDRQPSTMSVTIWFALAAPVSIRGVEVSGPGMVVSTAGTSPVLSPPDVRLTVTAMIATVARVARMARKPLPAKGDLRTVVATGCTQAGGCGGVGTPA